MYEDETRHKNVSILPRQEHVPLLAYRPTTPVATKKEVAAALHTLGVFYEITVPSNYAERQLHRFLREKHDSNSERSRARLQAEWEHCQNSMELSTRYYGEAVDLDPENEAFRIDWVRSVYKVLSHQDDKYKDMLNVLP